MTKTEKLSILMIGVVSGIAMYYMRKCKKLQIANDIQSEQIDNLWEFVNREDVDFHERDDYPFS